MFNIFKRKSDVEKLFKTIEKGKSAKAIELIDKIDNFS